MESLSTEFLLVGKILLIMEPISLQTEFLFVNETDSDGNSSKGIVTVGIIRISSKSLIKELLVMESLVMELLVMKSPVMELY